MPGVFLAADLIAWHASIHVTTVAVANATLLANLTPVFVTATAWLFRGTSITRAFLIGLSVALIGIVVLKGGLSGLAARKPVGDALAILAAMFYAGCMLTVARMRGRSTRCGSCYGARYRPRSVFYRWRFPPRASSFPSPVSAGPCSCD